MLKTHKRIGLILASRSGIATLSVVLVSACAAGLGTGAGTAGSQAPQQDPVSLQEYGTTLAGAVDPLESALKGLAKAR